MKQCVSHHDVYVGVSGGTYSERTVFEGRVGLGAAMVRAAARRAKRVLLRLGIVSW